MDDLFEVLGARSTIVAATPAKSSAVGGWRCDRRGYQGMTPDLVSAVLGAVVGAAFTLIVQLLCEHYTRRVERRRYAAALGHEIRRLSNKLDEYASSFERVKDDYERETGGFRYEQPPSNPINDHDSLIHRSSVCLIGTLDLCLAHDILDFYDKVRTLDEDERRVMEYVDEEEAFDCWIEYRRKLRDRGLGCAKKLDRYGKSPTDRITGLYQNKPSRIGPAARAKG